ncbi:hypothetical protein K438DRAFT_2114405 [Mycena galopus ATCC 62051]|nr:hypothetical protein K438DRAFT_1789391 [Mycena galopus ATCC 62051]KAF8142284.1 hypothetical protein K438DRAFT_2114405 [Mycena galopus ATCC 62051]
MLMLRCVIFVVAFLLLLLSGMAPLPTPPLSLPHHQQTSVRNARQNAMLPPYAVPHCSHNRHQPLQSIGNELHTPSDSKDPQQPARDADPQQPARDADQERQLALQETPSRQRRRIPASSSNENYRSISPTPGASTSRPPPRALLPTPSTTAPHTNARSEAQRRRREREAVVNQGAPPVH